MAKGRHRKQQLTQLPDGARAVTGKSRTASKAQTYQRLLPVVVQQLDKSQVDGGSRRGDRPSQYTFPAWADYLLTLFGYPGTSHKAREKQKEQEMNVVVGKWDSLSKSVYLEVTPLSTQKGAISSNDDKDEDAQEQQSASMRYLWDSGFFGKGTLSRSEPTWHKRQVNAIRVKRERERGGKVYTPEELTALRRKERKAAKIERARLAVRAGQQLADGIVALGGELTQEEERAIERAAESELKEEDKDESAYGKHIPGLIYLKPREEEVLTNGKSTMGQDTQPAFIGEGEGEEDFVDMEDMERLQLSGYETLFLAGMLGVLEVVDEEDKVLPLEHLYSLLLASALPHTALPTSPFSSPSQSQLISSQQHWTRPDNPFLLNYIVYHHFRSLGWVVKSGIKFCVDFLLYKRGPAFGHAEFAILVIPVYEDPDDEASSPFGKHINGNERNWVWFSSVNRVNTQVLKTVILCHVTIPPLSSLDANELSTPQALVKGLCEGRLYHIREYSIRRFTPQRMRA